MADADPKMLPAKRLFGFSILYLFALFAVLLGEAIVARAGLRLRWLRCRTTSSP